MCVVATELVYKQRLMACLIHTSGLPPLRLGILATCPNSQSDDGVELVHLELIRPLTKPELLSTSLR